MKKSMLAAILAGIVLFVAGCCDCEDPVGGNNNDGNDSTGNNGGNNKNNNIVGIWYRHQNSSDDITDFYTQYNADNTGFRIRYFVDKRNNVAYTHDVSYFTYNIYDDIVCYSNYICNDFKVKTINGETMLFEGGEASHRKVYTIPEEVKEILYK